MQSQAPEKDTKERILRSAAELIAHKGYSAVGVREIAAKADINISMISYYFGSKVGILKAIIEDYFKELKIVVADAAERGKNPEEVTKYFVSNLVTLIRRKTDICKVAFMQMPVDLPEVTEYKLNLLMEHMCLFGDGMKQIISNKKGENGNGNIVSYKDIKNKDKGTHL
ncbi:MAG: TetR/AcrR family transcriptional regulator, partial [Bacteroidota bacterium]